MQLLASYGLACSRSHCLVVTTGTRDPASLRRLKGVFYLVPTGPFRFPYSIRWKYFYLNRQPTNSLLPTTRRDWLKQARDRSSLVILTAEWIGCAGNYAWRSLQVGLKGVAIR